jgi:hypothetical protein
MTMNPRASQTVFLAIAVALLACASNGAQAQDKPKPIPVPLAPGVNKGNVDNITGPRYFWFWAGPGLVTINMAFKDFGLFGNPLRQSMHFNVYSAEGVLLSPLTLESVDRLERLSVPGMIPVRTKYVIEVKAQDATIRMGGYYELSVTGAVGFGTASNSTQKVQPIDTSLVHPGGPLTQ